MKMLVILDKELGVIGPFILKKNIKTINGGVSDLDFYSKAVDMSVKAVLDLFGKMRADVLGSLLYNTLNDYPHLVREVPLDERLV